MSKEKKASKVSLAMLKYRALELRKNYQLPFYLTTLINGLKSTENIDYVQCLVMLTEKLLRVKNYYKKYAEEDKASKQFVLKALSDLGF